VVVVATLLVEAHKAVGVRVLLRTTVVLLEAVQAAALVVAVAARLVKEVAEAGKVIIVLAETAALA